MYGINKDLKVHFIGIGGIGMSGIAEVLLNLGYKVSGSDLNEGSTVAKLREMGADVFIGHARENIKDVQVIVFSSAINEENPEYQKARELNLPIIKRAEMLAEIMRLKYGVAIAGSHGKTTTTSFMATILNKLEFQPTYIIGGIVKNLGGHASMGSGELLIAEADESDGSFLYLNPIMSVITNIDNDHLDYYGTIENLQKAFVEFANKIPFYGKLAINAHDKTSCEMIKEIKRPFLTFGIEGGEACVPNIDFVAKNITVEEDGTVFDLSFEGKITKFKISLFGDHNVLNALGAISISHELGASIEDIAKVIKDFEGVGRRLEVLYKDDKAIIIDDYAHHPTEINATIKSIKHRFPNKKLITVFEPHRYSRTKTFWHEFIDCFKDVDEAYISPIYAASETPIEYIDAEIMVKNINDKGTEATYIEDLDSLGKIFNKYKNQETVILTLGAGAISKKARLQINS